MNIFYDINDIQDDTLL